MLRWKWLGWRKRYGMGDKLEMGVGAQNVEVEMIGEKKLISTPYASPGESTC